MLFHSLEFAIFFPLVLSLYFVLSHSWQNRMLLLASYIFYGSWDWRYLSLIFISTSVDYVCGLRIHNADSIERKKNFLFISVATNLSLLGVFKYYDFFAESFAVLFSNFGFAVQPYFLDIALPVGISFYTFQTMSYTIEVYRGKLGPTKNFVNFALYVSFFPQLIAGPIERATSLLPQILKERNVSLGKVCRGAYFFFWGFFLKVFIADNLSELVDPVFSSSGPYEGKTVLLAIYAFSFIIYCDFAGYSFMAIGLALSMGIELTENFRRPYFSRNISDFWRRWHITLSSWFRDYVYIPLGGNQQGKVCQSFSLWATFILCGLWHGAQWKFILFGFYHAVIIIIYHYMKYYWEKLYSGVQVIITFNLVCVGWLVFRADSPSQAWEMLRSVFLNLKLDASLDFQSGLLSFAGLTVILIIVQLFQEHKNNTLVVLRLHWLPRSAFIIFLLCLILTFGDGGNKPFIYFQF